MAGAGAAPPVRLNDVAVLIGGVLVIAAFILLFWDPAVDFEPVEMDDESPPGTSTEFHTSQTFDLNDGDKVNIDLDLIECSDDDDIGDCGSVSLAWAEEGVELAAEDWSHYQLEEGESLEESFEVPSDGEWTLHLRSDSKVSFDMDVEHLWLTPWISMFAGLGLAGWGIWQSKGEDEG